MAIFAASYDPGVDPLTDSFRPIAHLRAPEIPVTAQARRDDVQSDVRTIETPALNPPPDTPQYHLRQVIRLLNRHDTTAAMDRIVRLLDLRGGLPEGMEQQLKSLGEIGLAHLRMTGQKQDAAYYAFRLQLSEPVPPALEYKLGAPVPHVPRPSFA